LRKYIVAILLFLPSSIQLKAQLFDEKNFTLYTTREGLSNDNATSVIQDTYGYIWIATRKGLNRFDGNTFQQFYSDRNGNSLPEDLITSLKLLDDEQIGALTPSGLHIINSRTLKSRNLLVPPDSLKNTIPVNNVKGVLSDKRGNIFILTVTGFYQFNNKDELIFRYDHYSKKDLETKPSRFGISMIMEGDDRILLATDKGLYIFSIAQKDLHPAGFNDDFFYRNVTSPMRFWFLHGDANTFSIKLQGGGEVFFFDIHNKKKQLVDAPSTFVEKLNTESKLIRLNDTLFVINGFENGLYFISYDKTSDSYHLQPNSSLENYTCSPILIDRNKQIWIATSRGLLRQKRVNGYVEKITLSQLGILLAYNNIPAIAVANNKIFVGSRYDGLLVFDQDSLKPIKRIDLSKLWAGNKDVNIVNSIIVYKDTLFSGWAGTWINTSNLTQGKIIFNGQDDKMPSDIRAFFRDSRDNIYISINTKNTFYYKKPNEDKFMPQDFGYNPLFRGSLPIRISEDPDGNIWFGIQGISRFNYSLQKFDIMLDSFPSIKIRRRGITSNLAFDHNGHIYFGVYENGLMIYDPVKKSISQLTRSEGLPDNIVRALCVINNKLWIGTENGLANYDLETKKISSFGIGEDIPTEPNTHFLFYYDSTHELLYAAFNRTIFRFDPNKLTKNTLPPDLFIDNIVVTGSETIYHPPAKMEIPYKHNNLVINLGAINFEDSYQQQFAYRFVNDENTDWQEIGPQRSIIVSNLSPGKHKLQVKVFIRNNSWPEQIRELIINVRPPFWKTVWFILLISLLLIAGLSAFFIYRIRRVRQKANIDRQLAELEMKGLHAQMNPHFIFNSLNSIKEMILEDEKQNASRYLSKFAQLIRTSLEQSRQTFISVKQCIDHLRQYLEMEKIRFDGFSYSILSDNELAIDEIQMAPMLIQPLVENAIWHGLQNKDGEKKLSIRFSSSGEQLICAIEDNGIGINQSKKNRSSLRPAHRSLGVTNIHERLVVLNEKYKMNCSLTITDRSELAGHNESGTLAILRLSIKNNL